MSYITREFKPYLEKSLNPVVDGLIHLRIHPNSITLLGLILIASGSAFIYFDKRYYGFAFLLIGVLMDAIDGHLARKSGVQSKFGAFLDSTVDRISDSLPFIAFALTYSKEGNEYYVLITLFAIIFSFLVSYTRARAESLGVENIGGLFERSERWIVLLIGILSGFDIYAISLIALGSAYTSFQRIYTAEKKLRYGGGKDEGNP